MRCRVSVDEITQKRTLDIRAEQALQDVGGVAAPAAAGIVRDVSEAHCRAASRASSRDGAIDCIIERGQPDLEAFALGPRKLREREREFLGLWTRSISQD
jgi:hypothetical protein